MNHFPLPDAFYQSLRAPNSVLLHSSRVDQDNHTTYLFLDPKDIITVSTPDEIADAFEHLDHWRTNGYFVAGYISYEAGFYFNPSLPHSRHLKALNLPLMWFGAYASPIVFDHFTGNITGPFESRLQTKVESDLRPRASQDYRLNTSKKDYKACIGAIKSQIQAGNIYQLNYTTELEFSIPNDPVAFYRHLTHSQPVSYGAYVHTPGFNLLSLSPELFFKLSENIIQTRPMKGTAHRGRSAREDEQIKAWLEQDEKNRAENLMIVDLLRNDLGRICRPHSIHVPELFKVQTYPSLHQMISIVQGRLRDNLSTLQLFEALFPCGSVTGAPKIKAMELVDQFELRPRGAYTGSIGYLSPSGEAQFNVAIRTITMKGKQARMGIGSGVVWDSEPETEFEECRLKASFLAQPLAGDIRLIETLRYENGYPLLERHLNRLSYSASCLNVALELDKVRRALLDKAQGLEKNTPYKVRLLVSCTGQIALETRFLEETSKTLEVCLAKTPMQASNIYLYHKTTNRHMYNQAYEKATRHGFADVLWFNQRGELTEGCISNVVLETNGRQLTPALECGLLPGVYREKLLDETPDCTEAILTPDTLKSANKIYICNAVRGMQQVTLKQVFIEDI